MSGVEDRDEGDEIKRKMAAEGPKIKKEFDRPGKLMVSGVPKNAEYTEEDLKREFSLFGPLLEVNIIRKKSTGIAKGFAFVTFKNPPDAEEATKGLEGKDIGGDNPIHCERAVIGFIKQSQIASSRKRVEMVDRGFRGGGMVRGRGGGRGQPPMERGRGFRGMRGGPPPRGGRGRGGGYGGGGDMDGMYYNEEEEYYGGGGGEYWEGDPHGGEYPPRGRGGARGGPPQRGMRGAPPGMRGRGGPPGARGGFTGRGGAGGPRGGYPGRGGPVPDRGGRPFRKTLLPNPPDMRGGRGGGMGRGYPPHPPANEEYYPEEEAAGYGEEYGAGGEEFYEEDPYNNGAGYTEEDQYGGGRMDEGYYGVPEAQPRHAPPGPPPARGRGGVGAAPPHRGGRNGPGAPQSYNNMGSEQPTRGGRPPASGPYSRGGGSIAGGGSGQMPMRGGGAQNRNAGPGRPMPSEPARRPPAQDPYNSYIEEEPAGPPRQRAGPPQSTGYEDYYGEEDMSSMHASQDPYASARPPAGRSQPPAAARGAPPRRAADPYPEEQYGMYEGGDGSAGYSEDYGNSYSGAAPVRRGPTPSAQPRPSPGGRQTEGRGYVDISEYIGLGAGSGSRFRDEYQGQGSGRDMDRMEREPRRPAPPSRREDPYMERGVAAETDVYESYPTSSRDPTVRKRPLDGYEASNAYVGYEEYRGAATPNKRERVERSGYDSYSSRQEGNYRRL